jgi:SAM-dependent methyltransferase
MMSYTAINATTIDRWVANGWEWGIPLSHECYLRAVSGDCHVHLTPTRAVPREWLGDVAGRRLLGLAAGGGQQMPIFSALGAICTVVDLSDAQLSSERMVAEREGYYIDIVKADMTRPLPFPDASFDLVFHPVSNCYVADVLHVWRECHRVLRSGGRLLAGMDNGLNFLFDGGPDSPLVVANKLPYNPLIDRALYKRDTKSGSGIQFSHSLEEQIGGQLRAGFVLKDLYEDRDKTGLLREYAPQYIATLAVK